MKNSGPYYLQPITNPTTDIQCKRFPIGIHSLNFIIVNIIQNLPLQHIEKPFANLSAHKTLIKNLKQNQVPKSKIISITRHQGNRVWNSLIMGTEFINSILLILLTIKLSSGSIHQHVISHNNPVFQNSWLSFFSSPQFQNSKSMSTKSPQSFCNFNVYFNVFCNQP